MVGADRRLRLMTLENSLTFAGIGEGSTLIFILGIHYPKVKSYFSI